MTRPQLAFVPALLLLVSACAGHGASETTPPAGNDGGGANDSGSPPDGAAEGSSTFDASVQLPACEGCLALHCATYGACERTPQCLQGLATYIDCTRQNPESTCSRGLEDDPAVPGDITLCLAASCTTDCSAH
jgi:hypothetical protein